MDASYTFLARKQIPDGEMTQPADVIEVSVIAKSTSEATKKVRTLLEDNNRYFCIIKIEER